MFSHEVVSALARFNRDAGLEEMGWKKDDVDLRNNSVL